MKMTIVNKINAGIGILAVVLIGLAIFFQMSISGTKKGIARIDEHTKLLAGLSDKMTDHFKWAEGLSVGTILLGREFTGQLDHKKCRFGEWYYSYTPPEALQEKFKKIEEPHMKLHATASKVISALKAGRYDLARNIYQEETMPALSATQEAIIGMRAGVKEMVENNMTEMKDMQERMVKTSLFVYLAILVSLLTGSILLFAKPIKTSLLNISEWVNSISTGNLTREAPVSSEDEISDIASNLNEMLRNIRNIIIRTKGASNQVSIAADQMAEANQDFSQRITEQAASIEETSATMEEMSASIRHTAENARDANKLAQHTRSLAQSGSIIMNDTITAMDEINRSSGKIANISNMIEEIAFQTNLLALNAAIEAARAGEHGRGFAVVASEIRNLAQRASQSAKEITGLIQDSEEKTGRGVQLAQELSRKLGEIGISVKKVTDLMDEVAAAAGEQASGINQMSMAVAQIDQTTQQNASLVEETASAADELAGQAKELMNLISFFTIDNEAAVESGHKQTVTPYLSVKKRGPEITQKSAVRTFSRGDSKTIFSPTPGNGDSDGGFEEF